jgi:SagB-type dehydrogenase family enzyme
MDFKAIVRGRIEPDSHVLVTRRIDVPASLLLSWRDGVTFDDDGAGELRLHGPTSQIVFKNLTQATRTVLQLLTAPGCNEEQLAELILDEGGSIALAGYYRRLDELAQRGFLCMAVWIDDKRILTLLPIGSTFTLLRSAALAETPLQLSRFAYLHRAGNNLILESPLAHARLVIDEPAVAAIIAALNVPASPSELIGRVTHIPADAISLLLSLMASAGVIHAVTPGRSDVENEPSALRSWEFHDLLFHSCIRLGRTDAPYGATYRLVGQLEPPPALKPERKGQSLDLYRPEMGRLEAHSLSSVIAQRRSVREYGDKPLTQRQLGEFLFRVFRVTGQQDIDIETLRGFVRMEFASRPFPAGGGLYELEVFTAVQNCDGIVPGLYYYDPLRHKLVGVRGRTSEFDRLVADAAASAGITSESVQVLVVLTSRFQRMAWKYASIAYALTLKHVGVAFQTMYLTATDMNLAPCALGGGDADLFARLAGTDYYSETSVGEFLLGSNPGIIIDPDQLGMGVVSKT